MAHESGGSRREGYKSCRRTPGFGVPLMNLEVGFQWISRVPLVRRARPRSASVYSKYVSAQSLTICELLEAFPSCKPASLGALLALLPPLPPRYYSIASSQLATPSSLAVAFSVVCHRLPVGPGHVVAGEGSASGTADGAGFGECVDGLGGSVTESTAANGDAVDGKGSSWVVRRGLCTSWLEGMLEPLLELSSGGAVPPEGRNIHVPVFMKPAKEFLLPASAKWPCVLIGPGTG